MDETRSKISSTLSRKRGKFNSYVDEQWFDSISDINKQFAQVYVTKASTQITIPGETSEIPATALTLNGEVITYGGENITYTT